MRRKFGLLLVMWLGSFIAGFAQNTNSGDIRGSVTDTTGALIPEVNVKVVNVDTQVSKDYITDGSGLYDTSSIVTGHYKLTFTKDGFSQFVRGPITLQVGVTTVNASLKIGSIDEQVVVTSDVPLLQTESSEQSTTLEAKSMGQLPNVGQDWENFTILLPGTSGAPGSNAGSANPGQFVSANGNLPYANVLADGATSTLPTSSNANVSVFETVAELQVSTSDFSAQYGIGGIIFNQITKGGTSKFHGSAYEYFQNDDMNAANFGFGSKVAVSYLRYNNFGGSVGGPILKKKMFFYFNVDKIKNISASSSGYLTIPTSDVMGGDFSGTGFPTIYDPTSQVVSGSTVTRKSFADEYGNGNKIPSGMIDSVAKAIQAYYPSTSSHPSTGNFVNGTTSGGIVTDNYYYSVPSTSPLIKYFGRLD